MNDFLSHHPSGGDDLPLARQHTHRFLAVYGRVARADDVTGGMVDGIA